MKVSTRGDYASRALLSLALHADGARASGSRDHVGQGEGIQVLAHVLAHVGPHREEDALADMVTRARGPGAPVAEDLRLDEALSN